MVDVVPKFKATFVTRRRHIPTLREHDSYVVEAYTGIDPSNPEHWTLLHMGTLVACDNYTKAMHAAIEPNMVESLTPRNLKRR